MVPVVLLSLAGCGDGSIRYHGYVEGEFVHVAAPISGRLLELPVSRGHTIDQGGVLFRLERSREQAALNEAEHRLAMTQARYADLTKGKRPEEIDVIRAQRAQAQAAVALAQSEHRRAQQLFAKGTIAREALDEARAENDQAAAKLREIEASLTTAGLGARSDERLAAEEEVKAAEAAVAQARWAFDEKAPIAAAAGLISDTYFRTGEWVEAGQAVVSLLPPKNRIVRFFVPEPFVSRIRPGSDVTVFCDGCGKPLTAQVSFVAPEAEFTPPVIYSREQRAHLVFRIEALPEVQDASHLAPGLPVEVEIPGG